MANFFDTLRSGGTVRGPLVVSPRTNLEVPLILQAIATSLTTDYALQIKNFAGTSVFSVTYAGDISFAGSGTITIDQTVTGNLVVNGNTTLGNAIGDTLSVVATTTFSNPVTINSTLTTSGVSSFANVLRFTANTTLNMANYEIGRNAGGNLQYMVPLTSQHVFSNEGNATLTIGSTQVAINSALTIGGKLTANGGSTLMGQTAFANGTAALPSITFASDLDTGLYRSAANVIGITSGGVAQFTITGDANSVATFNNATNGETSTAFKFTKTNTTANAYNVLVGFANAAGSNHSSIHAVSGAWTIGGAGTASDTMVFGSGILGGILQFGGNSGQSIGAQFKFLTGVTYTINDLSSPIPKGYKFTDGAHTALAVSTEFTSFNVSNSSTITFTTGAIATQRSVRFQQPTFASVGGVAMTITDGVNVSFSGAPSAGSGVTITKPTAVWVTGVTSQTTSAAMELSNLKSGLLTATLLNTTQVTSACGIANARFLATTIIQSGGAVTVDTVANVYIDGALSAGALVTFTNNYSLFVDAGPIRFDENVQWGAGVAVTAGNYSIGRDADATNQLHFNVPTGAGYEWSVNDTATALLNATNFQPATNDGNALGVSGTAWADLFLASGGEINWAASDVTLTHAAGALTLATAAQAGGANTFTITSGAHTAVTATKQDLVVTAHTLTITGGYTSQTFNAFNQPTISAASGLTITNSSTVSITAPTVAGSALITGTNALTLGSPVTGVSIANIASSTYSHLNANATTVTLTGTTQITSACAAAAGRFEIITIAQSGGAVTVDAAATVYIAGAVAVGASVTLTKSYSLWIDAGLPRIDSVTANNTVATVMSNVGPVGANTGIQEWLTIDINGTTRYIPCW